jgi:hypothetical protein
VQFVEKFQGDEQFSHADRVDPKPSSRVEALLQVRAVAGETLAEIATVVPAAEHPHEIAWEDDD